MILQQNRGAPETVNRNRATGFAVASAAYRFFSKLTFANVP
jgi:hypothetical protein